MESFKIDKTIAIVFCLIFLASCGHSFKEVDRPDASKVRHKVYNKVAVDLNNRAMKLSQAQLVWPVTDSSKLEQAITLLDSAIAIDSSYDIAYNNKVNLLCRLHRKSESIFTLEKMVKIFPKSATAWEMMGLAYESVDRITEADNCYEKSLGLYQNEYLLYKRYDDREEEIFLNFMLNRTSTADGLLRNLDSEFPTEEQRIRDFKESMLPFNRTKYINNKICK